MCTVSWSVEKGGYRLFFNRDEQLTRAAALPPLEWTTANHTFYGPKDPAGGGTWIGVDPHGWTTAVLNYYDATSVVPETRLRSRGELVSRLAPEKDNARVSEVLSGLDLSAYAPFHLLRVSPEGAGKGWTFDGAGMIAKEIQSADLPLTTSSQDTARVVARRKAIYVSLNAGGAVSADALGMFHRYFDSSDPAASVSMRRPDAQTVSLTKVVVRPKEITLEYAERATTGTGFQTPTVLKIQRIP